MQCGRVSARTVSYGTVYQLAVSARAISDSGVLAYECVMSYIFSKTLFQPFIFLSLSPCKVFLDQASVFIQIIVKLTIIVSSSMSKNTQIVDQKFLRMLAY